MTHKPKPEYTPAPPPGPVPPPPWPTQPAPVPATPGNPNPPQPAVDPVDISGDELGEAALGPLPGGEVDEIIEGILIPSQAGSKSLAREVKAWRTKYPA